MEPNIERADAARARQVRLALGGSPEPADFVGTHWVAGALGEDVGVISLLPGGEEPWSEGCVVGPFGREQAALLWAVWCHAEQPLRRSAPSATPVPRGEVYGGSIRVLQGLQAVRKRPGMYFGGTGIDGVWHLLGELIANALDEHLAGHASTIEVRVTGDGGFAVWDDGRGAPVAPVGDAQGLVERWCTVLHGGATADGHEGWRRHVHVGLHGVGLAAVSAAAESLEVTSWRDGQGWTQRFERGVPTTLPREVHATGVGTLVRVRPDRRLFDAVRLDRGFVRARLRQLGHLLPELTLRLGLHDLSSEMGLAGLLPGPATESHDLTHEGVRLQVVARPDPARPLRAFCNLVGIDGGAFVDALRARWPEHAVAVNLWLPEPVYDGRTRTHVSDPRALAALQAL